MLRYINFDGSNAAFGDSQVGEVSHIPGFGFFGPGGLQTVELNRLVRFLFAEVEPDKIIIELAPQWFGAYHVGRPEMISATALPPEFLKMALLSSHFYSALKDHFLAAAYDLLSVGDAAAGEFDEPEWRDIVTYADDWDRLKAEGGAAFNWSLFPAEKQRVLMLARAYAQNPVSDFQDSMTAAYLEDAVAYVISRGARLCFVEPPVTDDHRYLRDQIPGSNYRAFEPYANALANRFNVPWVRDVMEFTDADFDNQDHLHAEAHARYWPAVAKACFG
ncbi:hypothetical protein LL06_02025 [Hoeflea sp. BAL378]|nr:hypothetical protein LL06_02025 [Hoeflea sp. BAL378]